MYAPVELLAVSRRPAARFTDDSPAACTSSSDSWAACHPVFAVMSTRTNRVWVAGKAMVTVLPDPGSKA